MLNTTVQSTTAAASTIQHPPMKKALSMTAKYISYNTPAGMQEAGKRIREGRLVAFPTETVYGLGANALCTDAVLSIFKAKGRPLSDPVIVHVSSLTQALELVALDSDGKEIFTKLASKFWPGPLTLIAKASKILPSCVSAGTGYVGIRYPSHAVAQALITEAGRPIAAPSANLFGHVSPTTAVHVMNDLHASDIGILASSDDGDNDATCEIGIESTVAKIVPESSELLILRHGGCSVESLRAAKIEGLVIKSVDPHSSTDSSSNKSSTSTIIDQAQAPGQLLTHYAPNITTYLVPAGIDTKDAALPKDIATSVVLDFNAKRLSWKDKAIGYSDISPSGLMTEGMNRIYDALRWAEAIPNATRIYVTDVITASSVEHASALHDRMYRAASGKQWSSSASDDN